jgi:hypothetical protein
MQPFFSIWISPRKTFEFLSARDDSKNQQTMNILSALITIGFGIPQLDGLINQFDNHKIVGLIIGLILFSVIGILVIKIVAPLFYWLIGKLLKGQATIKQVQLIVVYSSIPYLIYLAIGLVLLIPALINENLDLVFYRHPFTYYVVWLLAIRNWIYGLSYFNKYTYGYALINILIPVGLFETIRLII